MTDIQCRFCRSSEGAVVVDLGHQPGSELFPRSDEPGPDPVFLLRLWLCRECGLAQLADDVEVPEDPQGDQPAALARQAEDAVALLAAAGVLPAPGATVTEFPSPHGGTWLPLLVAHGLTAAPPRKQADVVIDCCFGIMHAGDQRAAFQERADALRPGGVLLVQFHSLASMLALGEWNAVRHGHYAYYSVPAMRNILDGIGLTACSAFWFPLYGGTVLMAARRGGTPEEGLEELYAQEVVAGVLKPAVVGGLGAEVRNGATRLRRWLASQRSRGHRVYGYSAASRSVALLCSAGVDRGLLVGVGDAAAAKQGTRMPGTDIPVISPAELVAAKPDSVLLFVPDLLEEVRASLPGIESAGGEWVVVGDRVSLGSGTVAT